MVNDNRPTRGERDLAGIGEFDLAFDLITIEEGDVILILLGLVDELRHDLLQEAPHQIKGRRVINQDFINVRTKVIAQGSDDDVTFLEDQEGRRFFGGGSFDRLPQL